MYVNYFSTACFISSALCSFFGNKNCFQIPYCSPTNENRSILQFWLSPQKTTHCWNTVIIASVTNFMNFCLILIMNDVKVFGCSRSRYFTFKGSFSSEIFKVGFSEVSAVNINRWFLNIQGEKFFLIFNVVAISLILNQNEI